MADCEAGLGTLTRMEPGDCDVLLVVAEPSAKAVEVARRAVEMIASKKLGRLVLIANRFSAGDDLLLDPAFAGLVPIVVPDDPALRTADASGAAPFDAARGAPAVRALSALAATLVQEPGF